MLTFDPENLQEIFPFHWLLLGETVRKPRETDLKNVFFLKKIYPPRVISLQIGDYLFPSGDPGQFKRGCSEEDQNGQNYFTFL